MLRTGKKTDFEGDKFTYQIFVTLSVTTTFDLKQPRTVINLNVSNILRAIASPKFSILISNHFLNSYLTEYDF